MLAVALFINSKFAILLMLLSFCFSLKGLIQINSAEFDKSCELSNSLHQTFIILVLAPVTFSELAEPIAAQCKIASLASRWQLVLI